MKANEEKRSVNPTINSFFFRSPKCGSGDALSPKSQGDDTSWFFNLLAAHGREVLAPEVHSTEGKALMC